MSLMLGSVSTAPSWHGLWLRLIEDTTPARGALASALATRMAAPIARDPPQPLPPQTAQNTLKDLETKKIQREAPPIYQADGRQCFRLQFGASGP